MSRTVTVLLGILTAIMVGWVLHVGSGILQPLVIALLLASMLQPVIRGAARWRIPPAGMVLIIVVLMFLGLARLGLVLQTEISSYVGGGGWSGVKANLKDNIRAWDQVPLEFRDFLVSSIDQIRLQDLASDLIGGGLGFTKGLFLVLLYMVFIFAEQAVFRSKILSVAGENQAEARQILDTIGRGIQRYLGVKTVVSLATGAMCYAVLVTLKVPSAPLFGLLTFLLNYIPTFGSIIAGIFAAITALTVSVPTALFVALTYIVVNVVLGSVIEPRILGRELNLSPLVIIVSVVIWGGLWGVVGAFLAVPITAALQIILASAEATHPIAVMLSSGPPRDERRKFWKKGPSESEPETAA